MSRFSFLKTALILAVLATLLPSAALAAAQTALTPKQQLGEKLFFDPALSSEGNQSCASCHDPAAGFADPGNALTGFPVSEGSVAGLFGGRNSPSAAYAAFSPAFHWDSTRGVYVGGQFWDGRAATLAEQAQGPFLNPVEMALAGKAQFVSILQADPSGAGYQELFQAAYGSDISAIKIPDPMQPDPPSLEIAMIYKQAGEAVGQFESTTRFTPFSSKYDNVLAGKTKLNCMEAKGLALFNGKGKCNQCHRSTATTAPDLASGALIPPLFTDFTYYNLGLPTNQTILNVKPDAVVPDLGLGGRPDIVAVDSAGLQKGKFKAPTLRNVALTAPYGHNGVFPDLTSIVHYYNTRDMPMMGVCEDNLDPDFGTYCWPDPEYSATMNTALLGNLRLSMGEERHIVAFLLTLTDGWGPSQRPGCMMMSMR